MSKALAFAILLVGLALSSTDARTLNAAAYAPFNAKEEATETPAYKAEESFTGQGLYPGEAYAPNAPALVAEAAHAPAPEGAYLIKLANAFAPGGVPTVGALIDAAETGTPVACSKLAAAEKAAPALASQAQPAISPNPFPGD